MSPSDDETRHDPQRLETAAEHLDAFSDVAKVIQQTAKNASPISGHEWGAVGIAFSVNYQQLAETITDHIGMINKFLGDAEATMIVTARNYAGANQAILAKLKGLEKDLPVLRPAE
jgi:hypothetical protein